MRGKFKDIVTDLAENDPWVIVLLGDISVFQFRHFQERFPDRFHNMGICENALISVAAGLASQGYHPFVHTIAPFITDRSFEQIKLDMVYNDFGGNIVSCGASFDYAWDGATHHTYFDLAMLRMLPGAEVCQPGSEAELAALMPSQYANGKTTYFRLSDKPHDIDLGDDLAFGRGVVLKDVGAPMTVMTAGPMLAEVLPACQDLNVNLVYFHTLKPIDQALVTRFADTEIVVVQDAFGLSEAIAGVRPGLRMAVLGVDRMDRFETCYGTHHDMRAALQLDTAALRARIPTAFHSAA